MTLVAGRHSMTVYPCGCSVGHLDRAHITSVGVCELHMRRPAVELALMARVVEELGRSAGPPMVIDTVKMGDDFVQYMAERGIGDDAEEPVDGTA